MKININYSHPYDFKGLFSLDKIVDKLPKCVGMEGIRGIKGSYIAPFKVKSITTGKRKQFHLFDLFETFFVIEIFGKELTLREVHGHLRDHEIIQSLETSRPDERIETLLSNMIEYKERAIKKHIESTIKGLILSGADMSEFENNINQEIEIIY